MSWVKIDPCFQRATLHAKQVGEFSPMPTVRELTCWQIVARETTEFGPEPLAASDFLTVDIGAYKLLNVCVSYSADDDLYTMRHYTEAALQGAGPLQSEKSSFCQSGANVLYANPKIVNESDFFLSVLCS